MANPLYAQYSIEDFDKFDCLKISKWLYAMLAFVLRGYVVWIMSVTNMQDRVGIMQWIFPQKSLFYLSLLSGAMAIFLVFVVSLRRPEAPNWVQYCWRHFRFFIFTAFAFDLIVSFVAVYYWQLLSWSWFALQSAVVTVFVIATYKSQRLRINISEFPEKLPEK